MELLQSKIGNNNLKGFSKKTTASSSKSIRTKPARFPKGRFKLDLERINREKAMSKRDTQSLLGCVKGRKKTALVESKLKFASLHSA